ncbi:hypothetical protein XELAEV_18012834mg [Xenopus laevis]|uniref:Uncharacterized protein n=1 Tax=Xenopus laevis TaxID=8355 RepID=A0A974HYS7_XENLA|nr:hypothetical protein XELAEV_18012834mg [Xenopus laevis]
MPIFIFIACFIAVLIAALIKPNVYDKSKGITAASPASSVPEGNVSSTAHAKVVKRDLYAQLFEPNDNALVKMHVMAASTLNITDF